MSIEYHPVPKDKANFHRIEADIKQGLISGLKLDKVKNPQAGVFHIKDDKKNTLAVYDTDGVTFIEYNQTYNNVAGILKRLMKKYGFKVKIADEDKVISAEELVETYNIVNDPKHEVPVDFNNVFIHGTGGKLAHSGAWGRPYKYIKYESIDGKISRIR